MRYWISEKVIIRAQKELVEGTYIGSFRKLDGSIMAVVETSEGEVFVGLEKNVLKIPQPLERYRGG